MFTYHLFLPRDRKRVLDVINRVAAEGGFLQAGRFFPTLDWEKVLDEGTDQRSGRLLLVARWHNSLAGFCRLFPAEKNERATGNVGIVLLPEYRQKRAGTRLVELVIAAAPAYGYETLTADIFEDNFISLRLFRRQGFAEHSRRKLYLPHRNSVVEEIRLQLLLSDRHGRDQCQIIQPLIDP